MAPCGIVLDVPSDAAERLGDALARIMESRDVTQAELARRTKIAQGRISQWLNPNRETGRRKLLMYHDIERIEQAIGVPVGTILAAAGFVERAAGIRDALSNDPGLDPMDRAYLVDFYDRAVSRHQARSDGDRIGHNGPRPG